MSEPLLPKPDAAAALWFGYWMAMASRWSDEAMTMRALARSPLASHSYQQMRLVQAYTLDRLADDALAKATAWGSR